MKEIERIRENLRKEATEYSNKYNRFIHKGAISRPIKPLDFKTILEEVKRDSLKQRLIEIEMMHNREMELLERTTSDENIKPCGYCDKPLNIERKTTKYFHNIEVYEFPFYFCSDQHKRKWIFLKQRYPELSRNQLSAKIISETDLSFLEPKLNERFIEQYNKR